MFLPRCDRPNSHININNSKQYCTSFFQDSFLHLSSSPPPTPKDPLIMDLIPLKAVNITSNKKMLFIKYNFRKEIRKNETSFKIYSRILQKRKIVKFLIRNEIDVRILV